MSSGDVPLVSVGRRRRPGPIRLLTGYGLGAWLIVVPVQALDSGLPVDASLDRAIVAVVAGPGAGFVLARDGLVIRVDADGSRAVTASVGPLATPFATTVGERIVLGGTRDGAAVVTILDRYGRADEAVVLARAPRLDGLALAGTDGETVWVAGAGRLFGVDVADGTVVAEVPWTGGEPCVLDGVVHEMVASPVGGGFRLEVVSWSGGSWQPVGPPQSLSFGQNAYCSPDGYEVRDGTETPGLTPITTSTRQRYQLQGDGALLDVTDPAQPRSIGVTVPDVAADAMPPALLVDDSGGPLFWCAAGRCAVTTPAPGAPTEPLPWRSTDNRETSSGSEIHHYNLCSAACGGGVRPHTRDVVAWFVDHRRPAALSLNEACYDDVAALAGVPSRASYTALETAASCPGAVKSYGNHLLAWSPGGSSWSAPFPTQSTDRCDPREQECRGAACLTTGPEVLCSAHLETSRNGQAVAPAQAHEYLAFAGDAATAVLAGDFNLTRDEADTILGPAGYHSPPTGPTIATRQIDMIYTAGTPASTGDTYCDQQASDHCYLIVSLRPRRG